MNSITRRSLLKSAALLGSGLLLSNTVAQSAFAEAPNEPTYVENPEVEALWAEALKRSENESVDLSVDSNAISPRAFVSAYGEYKINALGEVLALYASLEVASNNVINQLYGWNLTTLYGLYTVDDIVSGGEVILDGGRTRAIHFTVCLKTVTGQASIRDGYAEIYYTGGVMLRA